MEEVIGGHIYEDLEFPPAPADRPYTFVNMIATIDGKILSGDRDESVHDLGSKHDKALMKRIEERADAVMLGAHTLRATPKSWNPKTRIRIVVTNSGDLPYDHCFLRDGVPLLATSGSSGVADRPGIETVRTGQDRVDFKELLGLLKIRGVERLLVMGGSKLNAQLFRDDLLDEVFLTLAPKIKLGQDVPTIADGTPLAREELKEFSLVQHAAIGDELFLRYRRNG